MKQFLFLVLIVAPVRVLVAQVPENPAKGVGMVYGTVLDSLTRKPVEFANVTLIDPISGKPVNGTVCDDRGEYAIRKIGNGNYILAISFIGFETRKIPVTIADGMSDVNLGVLFISPLAKMLKEVIVQGQKTLVEEKVDRTIYNAEFDLTTKGGDATDVLKRVPLLSVDMDGNVSLRGSSNVIVLINNKPSTISSTSVADALKQIPADMIKNVEVITSPSSRYDAEGSAGIINIVLKKNALNGKFLSVDGTFGNRGSNLSLNGSYRKGKMGFSLGAFSRGSYNVLGDFYNTQTTHSNGDTVLNIQSAHTRSNGITNQITFGWDYDISKTSSLTTSVRYGQRNQNAYQDHLYTEKYPSGAASSFLLQQVKNTVAGGNFDASMTYLKKFARKDRTLSFMSIYSLNAPTTGYVTDSLDQYYNTVMKSNKNLNHGRVEEVTLQADFQEPISENHLIEFGAKDIVRSVTSRYEYSVKEGVLEYQPSSNPLLSNGFDYNQSITSGYLSYTFTTASDYTFKAGGRYEYTHLNAHFQGQPEINVPSYGVLVPSINISRKLKSGNLLKASYNRRIQRPSLRELNPNLQASNGLNATIGNPYLKPEYADNFELAYRTFIKGASINMSTYVRYNTNDIQQARTIRNDTIIAVYQNIGTEANYGASLFASVPVSNAFSINGGIDSYYRILKNNSNDPAINATNHGLVVNIRFFGNYSFSKGWAMQFFAFFPGKSINLQGYRTNPMTQSLAVKKEILHKSASIGLGVDNFATPVYKVHSQLNSIYLSQYTSNTLYNFIVKMTFSYKVGKLNQDKKAPEEDDAGQ